MLHEKEVKWQRDHMVTSSAEFNFFVNAFRDERNIFERPNHVPIDCQKIPSPNSRANMST
jgi:hypothetical protein